MKSLNLDVRNKQYCLNLTYFAGADSITPCSSKLLEMDMWYSYFCRWFPSTTLSKGFSSNVILQLQQKRLMEEVAYLEDRLLQLQHTTMSSIEVSTNSHHKVY